MAQIDWCIASLTPNEEFISLSLYVISHLPHAFEIKFFHWGDPLKMLKSQNDELPYWLEHPCGLFQGFIEFQFPFAFILKVGALESRFCGATTKLGLLEATKVLWSCAPLLCHDCGML